MAIVDRPKKSPRGTVAAPKSARVDHAFDTSVEDWLAQISADQHAIAEAEAARIAAELDVPTATPRMLAHTEGEAPVIGDVCELDPDDIVLVHPAAHLEQPLTVAAEPLPSPLPPLRPDAVEPAAPRRARRGLLIGIGVAAVAACAVALAITLPRESAPVAAPLGLAAAQTWVAGNVAPDARVLIEDELSTGLVGAGFAAESVLPLSLLRADPDPAAWQSADFVLATDGLRADPDAEVTQALANARTVASFDDVQVLQVLPEGTVGEAAATAARAALGAQLASNPALTLAPEAAAALTAGQVDERIVILLGEALADHPLAVADFPVEGTTPAGEPDGLRHRVLLSSYDGAPLQTDPAGVTAAIAWLQNLTPPYTPLTVEAGPLGVLATLSLGDPTAG